MSCCVSGTFWNSRICGDIRSPSGCGLVPSGLVSYQQANGAASFTAGRARPSFHNGWELYFCFTTEGRTPILTCFNRANSPTSLVWRMGAGPNCAPPFLHFSTSGPPRLFLSPWWAVRPFVFLHYGVATWMSNSQMPRIFPKSIFGPQFFRLLRKVVVQVCF